MKIIVAADNNWAIGNDGQLLVSIPSDLKAFQKETTGKVIVYGRKTLHTFPRQMTLPDRENIILSRNPDYEEKGADVVHSIDELLEKVSGYNSDDVFVVGGAEIYEQLLPYCNICYVTKLDREFEADAFFPNLDKDPDWELYEESDELVYFDTPYTYLTYIRKGTKIM
ncbi:MAG: dihydrofolate reductase [Butyrivibrio sp.]|nr:dihydrofolate reductase [Butyrivibrio sp.]